MLPLATVGRNIFTAVMPFDKLPIHMVVQWNLGIRNTQGTVRNCPELCGGLISQAYFYLLNRPRD